MEILIAILVGILYTAGTYMILRRSILKFILGIIFLSNATNLLVFLSAGIVPGKPPIIGVSDSGSNGLTEAQAQAQAMADPLPQALVLTAIVIGFGIMVFVLALKFKYFQVTGTDDLDQLKKTDND